MEQQLGAEVNQTTATHTSLAFSLLFSPQRPRAGEKEKEGITTFFSFFLFFALLGVMSSVGSEDLLNMHIGGQSFKTQKMDVINEALLLSSFEYVGTIGTAYRTHCIT